VKRRDKIRRGEERREEIRKTRQEETREMQEGIGAWAHVML